MLSCAGRLGIRAVLVMIKAMNAKKNRRIRSLAYYGYTQYDMMYDADKVVDVAVRATQESQLDIQIGAGALSGKVMKILEDKQFQWPGHGVPLDNTLQYAD